MLSLIELAVLSVVTWRISRIIVHENSPFNLIRMLRNRVIAVESPLWDWLVDLFLCVHCVSVWVGLTIAFTLWYTGYSQSPMIIFYPFAFSGGAVIINTLYERLHE